MTLETISQTQPTDSHRLNLALKVADLLWIISKFQILNSEF